MLANLVCSLIKNKRVTTTLAKAKAARPVAEKLVTLGKKGTLHTRRLAAARLRQQARTLHKSKEKREAWRQNEDVVRILFEDLAPTFKDRAGGYTRILRLAERRGDAAQLAILEWVEGGEETPVETVTEPAEEKPKAKKEASKKKAAKKAAKEEDAPEEAKAEEAEAEAEEPKAEADTKADDAAAEEGDDKEKKD